MTTVHLSVAAAVDRPLINSSGGSRRYLVARLLAERAEAPARTERPTRNIALAIDASGSMSGARLRAAKRAALGLVQRLSPHDRVTLVSFASEVILHLDGVTPGTDNALRIGAEINAIETRGRTNLSEGWLCAVDRAAALAETDPRMTPRIILLSDGHANTGITSPDMLSRHASELRNRGVLTSTLGIGDGYDERLLRSLAEAGGGRFHDAELADEIDSVLLGELDDIDATAIEDVCLELTMPDGFTARLLGRGQGAPHHGRLCIPLGPLQDRIARRAVFQLVCPPSAPGTVHNFKVHARGLAVTDGTAVFAEAPEVALRSAPREELRHQERDREVATSAARAWHADIVSRVAAARQHDDSDEVARTIRHALVHFRRYAEDLPGGLELIEELELLAKRARRHLSPRLRKELALDAALYTEARQDHRGVAKDHWSVRIRRGE